MPGRELLNDKNASDEFAFENGLININAHIKNITNNFNIPFVVALNKFDDKSKSELETIKRRPIEAGAF